jgi:hypothetical protein
MPSVAERLFQEGYEQGLQIAQCIGAIQLLQELLNLEVTPRRVLVEWSIEDLRTLTTELRNRAINELPKAREAHCVATEEHAQPSPTDSTSRDHGRVT